jgi:hypothetical protein
MSMSMRSIARAGAALVVLGGCGSSGKSAGGPAAVGDGSYAFLASSAAGPASATLDIAGQELTLTEAGTATTGTIGEAAPEVVLCPPSGRGQPLRVDAALSVATVTLSSPAVFGDCGQVTPKRVTIVDLDSLDEAAGPLAYTRWVEFCDTSDPDCRGTR